MTATVAPTVDMGIKIVFVWKKKLVYRHNHKKNIQKTKALIAVDLYVLMPNYKELVSICKKKNIFD